MKLGQWLVIANIFLLGMMMVSCNENDDDDFEQTEETDETTDSISDDTEEYALVNEWIYETMSTYYFWEDELVSVSTYDEDEPSDFFYGLLNDDDHWSYISDDYEEVMADYDGTPTTMGYSPAFYLRSSSSDEVIIIVKYVYPDSPAELAGLQRGDIILTIDGETMDTDNYYDLYSGSSYVVGLGSYDYTNDVFEENGESLSMTAAVVAADPSIFHSVIEENGVKIGYLVYTTFTTGTDDIYLNSFDDIVDEFISEGVTELVVDLRYNGGGDPDAAAHLGSAIAPLNVSSNEEVFMRMDYNDLLDNYFLQSEGSSSSNLVARFPETSHNLNLSTVYFMVTDGTASASEALITGLQPYMSTVLIGDSTYGKYTGMFLLYDTDEPRSHDYVAMPVVLKYENADGYTDFEDGLIPDYQVTDYLIPAIPFGDLTDPLLAKAIEVITGEVSTASLVKSTQVQIPREQLVSMEMKLKRNLVIRPDK
jgi:C-terminal processing protease CtpA/Prc